MKPDIPTGKIKAYEIDTTIGVTCWASPPLEVGSYLDWLRCQYKSNKEFSIRIKSAARQFTKGYPLVFSGPHVIELQCALLKLEQHKNKPAKS